MKDRRGCRGRRHRGGRGGEEREPGDQQLKKPTNGNHYQREFESAAQLSVSPGMSHSGGQTHTHTHNEMK